MEIEEDPNKLDIVSTNIDGCGYPADGKRAVIGALEGEQIFGEPFTKTKGKRFFRIKNVIQTSPERVEPVCEVANVCGGCSFQHVNSEYQLRLKEEYLASLIGPLQPERWAKPINLNNYFYRTRARLGVRYVEKKAKVLIGFREKLKSYITDMESCPIMIERASNMLGPLTKTVQELSVRKALPQIEVVAGDKQIGLIFRHLEPLTNADEQALASFSTRFDIHIFLQSGGPETIKKLFPKDLKQDFYYELPAFNLRFTFSLQDFTQINLEVNRHLVNSVISLLDIKKDDRVLDAFCGIGNFSLPIARAGAFVYGVEYSESSVRRARTNAELNNIHNCSFQACDLASSSQKIEALGDVNKIVLDPPRSGASEFISGLPIQNIERIVYVSCNPITFAKDIGVLVKKGFELKVAGVVNMFPHTTHVESLALLSRTGN